MNDNDKAGRYLCKRDPAGQLRWLLANAALAFHAWIDSRRVVLPNQRDLTQDLVAAVRSGDVLEAFCLELEAEARADSVARVLRYLVGVWTEPGGGESLEVSCVSGVILDLTGRSRARNLRLRSAITSGCALQFTVLRRSLAHEDAAALAAGVLAGSISPWVLGWVPLMRGGGESSIISQWRAAAERLLTEERDRCELGSLTMVFATLARRRAAWQAGLRGWNMETNPYLDEIRAKVRAETRVEALEQGRAEEARAFVLRLGRRKFGRAPTRKQQQALDAVADVEQLETLGEGLFRADSWAELLNGSE